MARDASSPAETSLAKGGEEGTMDTETIKNDSYQMYCVAVFMEDD